MAVKQHIDACFYAQYKIYVAECLPFNVVDSLLSFTGVVYILQGLTSFHRAFSWTNAPFFLFYKNRPQCKHAWELLDATGMSMHKAEAKTKW